MALSPPKWIAKQRRQERLRQTHRHIRLLALADEWEAAAEGMSTGSDYGPDVYAACAHELRRVLGVAD